MEAFLSIVDKGGKGTTLLVRANRAGDTERGFSDAEVITGGGTDYHYRTRVPRERVVEKLAEAIRGITCPNIKSAVTTPSWHDAYMDIWSAMYRYQQREH
jgi:hypothetical protein